MDALVNSVTQYIDFLVLGAVALLIWSIPFTLHDPIVRWWNFLLEKCFPSAAQGNKEKERDRYSKFISVGLAGGLLFAIFYFSGYMLNAFGHAMLQSAHVGVIHESRFMYEGGNKDKLLPKSDLFVRPLPLFGKEADIPEEAETYRQDAIRQMHWQICDKASHDDVFGGTLVKQLRISRGAVAILMLLVPASLIALGINVYVNRKSRKKNKDSNDYENRAAFEKWDRIPWWKRWGWPIGSLAVAVALYWCAFMPMWRNAEHEAHGINWAVFPYDKDLKTLPCKKENFEHAVRNNAMLSNPPAKDDPSTKKGK